MSSSDLQQTLFSLVTADKYFVEYISLPALPAAAAALSNNTTAQHHPQQQQRLTRVLGHAPPPLPQDHAFLALIAQFDITRISNRLLACGLPWLNQSDLRAHRNNIHDLAHFLNTRYGSNYMLWNLAGMYPCIHACFLAFWPKKGWKKHWLVWLILGG
jgi:hypothetical protein